jgi:hypothetical protein
MEMERWKLCSCNGCYEPVYYIFTLCNKHFQESNPSADFLRKPDPSESAVETLRTQPIRQSRYIPFNKYYDTPVFASSAATQNIKFGNIEMDVSTANALMAIWTPDSDMLKIRDDKEVLFCHETKESLEDLPEDDQDTLYSDHPMDTHKRNNVFEDAVFHRPDSMLDDDEMSMLEKIYFDPDF